MAIFRTMARHPRLLEHFNVLAGFFRDREELAARDRELVVLRTAWRSGSEYEWAQHVLIGARAGLTQDEIALIARPGLAGHWPPRDAALPGLPSGRLAHRDPPLPRRTSLPRARRHRLGRNHGGTA